MKTKAEGAKKVWDKYKYAVLVALVGAVLLLWPQGAEETSSPVSAAVSSETETARDLERELETALGQIRGVGQVRLLLTAETDGQRQLAQDTSLSYRGSAESPEDFSRSAETVLSGGGSGQGPVVLQRQYPTWRGALVVCQGADQPAVRLAVTEAVAALTGLSTDRIAVVRSE